MPNISLILALLASGLGSALWLLLRNSRPTDPVEPGEPPPKASAPEPVDIKTYKTDAVAILLHDVLRINTRTRMFLFLLGLDILMFYGLSHLTGSLWPKAKFFSASEDLLRAVSGFVLVPLASTYYIAQLAYYPRVFNDLYLDGALDFSQKEFEIFMRRLERQYNWVGWYLIAALLLAAAFYVWIPVQLELPANWYVSEHPWTFKYIRVPYNFFQWFLLVMASFRHVVTWFALLRLIRQRKLRVRLLHPDRCAGLRQVGQLPIFVLPGFALAAMKLITLMIRESNLGYPIVHFDFMLGWAYYFIVVVSSILLPILPAQRLIGRARREFVRQVFVRSQTRIKNIDVELRSSVETVTLYDELAQLKELRQTMHSLPRWPIAFRDLSTVTFSVITPLLFGVITETVASIVAKGLVGT